ncbi:MAG: hypothetical protein K8R53_05500, partial [Bacteroidales bacterium]|nr:hypothetical protein [Bacteroidales bacterium]
MKLYIGYALGAVVLALFVFAGLKYYRNYKQPLLNAIDAIPENVAFFLEIGDPGATWEKLNHRSELWAELTRFDQIMRLNDRLLFIDSVLLQNGTVNDLIRNNILLLAFVPVDSVNNELLIILENPQMVEEVTVDDYIREINGEQSIILKNSYKKINISHINFAAFTQTFKFTTYSNLLIGSFSEELIKKAFNMAEGNLTILQDEGLNKLKTTAGKNVDANLYFRYDYAAGMIQNMVSEKYLPWLENIGRFGDWTETDLIIKNDELLLNGYSITSDTSSKYLNIYRHEPITTDITSILPYSVTSLTILSIGQISKYIDEYRQFLHGTGDLSDFNQSLRDIG